MVVLVLGIWLSIFLRPRDSVLLAGLLNSPLDSKVIRLTGQPKSSEFLRGRRMAWIIYQRGRERTRGVAIGSNGEIPVSFTLRGSSAEVTEREIRAAAMRAALSRRDRALARTLRGAELVDRDRPERTVWRPPSAARRPMLAPRVAAVAGLLAIATTVAVLLSTVGDGASLEAEAATIAWASSPATTPEDVSIRHLERIQAWSRDRVERVALLKLIPMATAMPAAGRKERNERIRMARSILVDKGFTVDEMVSAVMAAALEEGAKTQMVRQLRRLFDG